MRAASHIKRLALIVPVLIAASLTQAAPSGAAVDAYAGHARGIVVRATGASALDGVAAAASRLGHHEVARSGDLAALHLTLSDGQDITRALAALLRLPGVVYAEPLYPARAARVPADPLYAVRQRAYLEPVGGPAAWDLGTGDGVIVAVIDTGVDTTHVDLQGRMWVNEREVPGNGRDDDDNGCVDDVHGCSFVSFPEAGCQRREGGDAGDDSGHGTFVAGVIAANANNGQGIAGVAPDARVMAVKVLDCAGGGNSFQVAQGILYAAENGARVINISLGGPNDPLVVREAVRAVTAEHGALVVAASGNTGEQGVSYPARYAETLAVGAASIADPTKRAPFSTYGPEVDVAAIGEQIVGTVPQVHCGHLLPCLAGGPYAIGNGTSFAAPQVAGLAALVFSRRPAATPQQVHDIIRNTARPIPAAGTPNWAGAGLVDMAAALRPAFRLGTPGTARE